MKPDHRVKVLINLPPTFFTQAFLARQYARLDRFAQVRQTSHNTLEELMPDLAWAEAVLMWAWPVFTADDLANAPELSFIGQINSTQTHIRAAVQRGIAISEARHCWSQAVAEMALGLILNGLRKISDYHAQMRTGQEVWSQGDLSELDPLERELTGASVGIVGFGGIGQRLAEFLAPFEVDLRIYDPYLPVEIAQKYGAEPAALPALLSASDVVVLCAANNEGSRHLIGAKEIEMLRKESVLVNVGRASLVDTAALIQRLKRNDLVALVDVFDQEPLPPDSPLRSLPNAYLTPHRAGGVAAAIERALKMLIDDLEAFLDDQPRRYAIDESMLASFPER